jgi:putative Ca2+/H+ antiporter (TMEM165/GDT1 family)
MDWGTLASTFGLIFVAELGDKTQLAVVTQTCKYHRPWAVFWGASTALTVVTLIGAIGGQLLSQWIPQAALRIAAALAFVAMGLLIGREAIKAGRNAAAACGPGPGLCSKGIARSPLTPAWDWKAFGSTFGLLFVAELGDKTQLAVLSLAGKHRAPWPVFLGGAAALTAVTALGAIGGQGLCRLVPERLLLWISAAAFVAMGILMGLGLL